MPLDTNTQVFFDYQVDRLSKIVYDEVFPDLKGPLFVPVGEPAGAGAETYSYQFQTQQGKAKIVSAYSDNWPEIGIAGFGHTVRIFPIGAQFTVNFQEVRTAMLAGRDISGDKARAMRRAIEEEQNDIIMVGKPTHGIMGLLNNSFIPVKPLGFAINSTSTVDQILDTLNDLIDTPLKASNTSQFAPNMLVMDLDSYRHIANRIISTTNSSNITILDHLLNVHRDKGLMIDWAPECKGAGLNGRDIMIAYKRDRYYIEHQLALPLELLRPDQTSIKTVVKGHQRTAGVVPKYPNAAIQGEQPLAA